MNEVWSRRRSFPSSPSNPPTSPSTYQPATFFCKQPSICSFLWVASSSLSLSSFFCWSSPFWVLGFFSSFPYVVVVLGWVGRDGWLTYVIRRLVDGNRWRRKMAQIPELSLVVRSALYFFAVSTSCTLRNGGTVTGFASLNVRSFAHGCCLFCIFCWVWFGVKYIVGSLFYSGLCSLPRSAHAI